MLWKVKASRPHLIFRIRTSLWGLVLLGIADNIVDAHVLDILSRVLLVLFAAFCIAVTLACVDASR